jgi:hypothetical protein
MQARGEGPAEGALLWEGGHRRADWPLRRARLAARPTSPFSVHSHCVSLVLGAAVGVPKHARQVDLGVGVGIDVHAVVGHGQLCQRLLKELSVGEGCGGGRSGSAGAREVWGGACGAWWRQLAEAGERRFNARYALLLLLPGTGRGRRVAEAPRPCARTWRTEHQHAAGRQRRGRRGRRRRRQQRQQLDTAVGGRR